MPSTTYTVQVASDHLGFAAGHFITYDGDHCERLHGHNYRVAVDVEDDLDPNHYVVDFLALKQWTRSILDELEHRMLLPSRSPLLALEEDGPNWTVRYHDRRWSFPREDCVVLPVANTTAELLADYINGRLRREWESRGLVGPRILRVEVEESPGQKARAEWRRDTING